MEPPLSRVPRRWTAEEDRILREEANYQRRWNRPHPIGADELSRLSVTDRVVANGSVRDWNKIAAKLPGRMNKDCRKRWSKISENIKKGNWDPGEDAKLREAVTVVGTRWTQVAEMVGTRHADQCAKRWTQCLDPNIDHSDWKEEEDNRLLAQVAETGRDWRKIAELFPGRTKLGLKNRYTALRRRLHSHQGKPGTNDRRAPSGSASSSQVLQSATDKLMQMSDGLPSSEDEVCQSACSTRPISRSSMRSRRSPHQSSAFNMGVESSPGIGGQTGHSGSDGFFSYLPPSAANQNYGYDRRDLSSSMLSQAHFSTMNPSHMEEPMLTPRANFLPSSLYDTSFPLNSSNLSNEWLSGSSSNQNIGSSFPFPHGFDCSPLGGGNIDPSYQSAQPSSRKTTIVLEDIEETTLSKVMNILIQEKAKVRMETTHSDRPTEHR
ncbi:uncharacterized protein Z518_06191 [Rhinocladiella mackenziei CBS 650.93]|uniref:Uncharacterized protein n=1 Tax=Rhinocladiella mackenziei CBS 650.93 TaxID=1442369 RepID=A0A0D2IHQ6_9EURO|nr:uncharacterized protein Z518_06191 [Rhinocladiella mackenziei CBS 650.93]KIX05319.1 hypothetical protein Z518_06191 [Rhinocladiella mackenziei CBS 650.93]